MLYSRQSTIEAASKDGSFVCLRLAIADTRQPAASRIDVTIVQQGQPNRSLQFHGARNVICSLAAYLDNTGVEVRQTDILAEMAWAFLA